MNLVKFDNGELVTTSKLIADAFGKTHRDVLRTVRYLECGAMFKKKNFKVSSYVSAQNKILKCFDITRDGAMFLCMGFTGDRAADKKEMLLDAFNNRDMVEVLKTIAMMDVDVNQPGLFVYVAQESTSKRYKIGISKHPSKRVKQLNVGNPEELVLVYSYPAKDDKYKSETIAHAIYRDEKLNGEWFCDDIDLALLPSYKT